MSKTKNFRAAWEKFFEKEASDKGIEKEKVREMWEKFFEEEVLDRMVEDGIFQVSGVNEEDRKTYALTAAGRSPHLIVNPPKRTQ